MGRRGAHVKQVVHVSEAGGVETQRLVEHGQIRRYGVLPRPKGGMLRGRQPQERLRGRQVGPKRREGVGAGAYVTRGVGPTGEWVAWAGAERTESMYCMSVTLDVLKVSGWLNAYAYCRVQRKGIYEGAAGGPGDGRALSGWPK